MSVVQLNALETDLIDFICETRGFEREQVARKFVDIREHFGRFRGGEYERAGAALTAMLQLFFMGRDERTVVEAYRHFAPIHLFRHISYSYPKTARDYWRETVQLARKGRYREILRFGWGKLSGSKRRAGTSGDAASQPSLARRLCDAVEGPPVIVDYGSGMGLVSFAIGGMESASKVYLVDLDCLILDFAEYRFRKHGRDVQAIRVTAESFYPELPEHNLCIATEVMEHLPDPVAVYENIHRAMRAGGILYGNFEDHEAGLFHLSPDLSRLRARIAEDYESVGDRCYRKKG